MSNSDKKPDPNDPFNFFKLSPDNGDKDKKNNGKKPKIPFWGVLLAGLAVIGLLNLLLVSRSGNDAISFSEFRNLIEKGEITNVELGDAYFFGYSDDYKSSTLPEQNLFSLFSSRKQVSPYKTVAILTEDFLKFMDENNVNYRATARQNNFILELILNWVVPIGFFLIMWRLIFRKMGGGLGDGIFSAGSNRNAAIEEGQVKTRFSDVAGVDEAKEELEEVVDFLKAPKKYTDIGGKIPKGVLLVGPPGTGKTLLARAVAGEAGVPFFRISGSDFVEMFVGVGASRVRDLFKKAREKAPCIIFIDELDAIGKSRINSVSGGNDEREQTLNQLLVEMDGFDNEKGLIVLAATNRADVLDPALLRPGRFDRQVPVECPDVKGREAILRIHAKNVKLDSDVDFNSIAHGTIGFAGADLANVVNEAALLAVRNGRKKVSMVDFNDAIDKVSMGLKKKNKKENEKERWLIAYHETGHALIGAFTPDYPPVNKITVVPRSHGVGGFTQYREQEERSFQTKRDMINDVDNCLGGRAAEEVMLGEISTGASNDIARATEIIKRMITDYGMSEKFKNITLGKGVLGNRGGEPSIIREFSEETQNFIDEEIARIMKERYEHVLNTLKENKELLEYIAKRLLEIETMEGKEFYDIVNAAKHLETLPQSDTQPEAAIAEQPEASTQAAGKEQPETAESPEAEAKNAEE